jgi:O-acetyl-ADP-ribose deacetylase (regulator of RNase III)
VIQYVSGDLLQSDAQVLVNPVNCVGVMGKGLAQAFAEHFPGILAPYKRACAEGRLRPGQVQFLTLPDGRAIANLPTKDHWRNPSRIEWVASGLAALRSKMAARGLTTVAVPPLGAGLGGLPWPYVASAIEAEFSADPAITALVFQPR